MNPGPTLRRLLRLSQIVEETVLAVVVIAVIALGALQIVLRNFFKTGIRGVDSFVDVALLWLTMLGALAATGLGRHIRIDAVSHFLGARTRAVVGVVTGLFAAALCVVLAVSSVRYLGIEREMGRTAFAGVPLWIAYGIMPVGFAAMALRFLVHAGEGVAGLLRRAPSPPPGAGT